MAEVPATIEQLMEAVAAMLAEIAPEMSSEERTAALGLFRDKFAVAAEQMEELPTLREISDALDPPGGSES
jgi:hypothetical protein